MTHYAEKDNVKDAEIKKQKDGKKKKTDEKKNEQVKKALEKVDGETIHLRFM